MKVIMVLAMLLFTVSSNALEVSEAEIANGIFLIKVAGVTEKCQLVLNSNNHRDVISAIGVLQNSDLKIKRAEYVEDEARTLTFWAEDQYVRNINCLLQK